MAAGKGVIRKVLDLEPLMTRGTVVAVLGVVGMVLNTEFADGSAQYILNIILGAFGLLTAIVTRPAVTPDKKVLTYLPSPTTHPNVIESGAARDPQ